MRKSDGEPTSKLEAHVRELQGKTAAKKGPYKKAVSSAAVEKYPKGYWWAFGVAFVNTEKIKQLSILPGLLDDPSVVGLVHVKEQQVLIGIMMMHQRQYHTNRDSLVPIHELIHHLETQGVISKTHPLIVPYGEEWKLTVDYHGLNEVTPLLSAAVLETLDLQYELESKVEEVFEKRKRIIQNLLRASFAIKQSKAKRPAQEIEFLGVKWQDGRCDIHMDVINKITTMTPTS
ncbi:hypothetical protein QYF61_004269 [Mycteria americana]|uniref:Uncharacterized protein n=1 Tax=Mycteria americana TaxID=33587 RepID=A0AAN7MQM6_MYCAM|nr:hypothetical protein QYF61_004269 [Mycteria americana]